MTDNGLTGLRRKDTARALLSAALGAWLLAGAIPAAAHGGATGVVKERMETMSEIADASKAISAMVKGKRALDPARIESLATTIGDHAARIPALFPDTPASRSGPKTEALPAVWENRDEFDALAAELGERARSLAASAAGADEQANERQFAGVAKTCRGCHKQFRQKKRR